MSLLEQNITRKRQIDKKKAKQLEFEAGGNNKEYKIESICDSAVYTKKSETGHLLGLYYEKPTLRIKTLRNLHQQYSTSKNWLTPFIKTLIN